MLLVRAGRRTWVRAWGAGAVLLMIGALGGCKGERLTVKKLLVDVEPAAEAEVDREHVRDTVRRLVDGSDAFNLKEGATEGATVRVRLFVATNGRAPPMGAGANPGGRPILPDVAKEHAEKKAAQKAAAHAEVKGSEAAVLQHHPAMVSLSVAASGGKKGGGRYRFRGSGIIREPAVEGKTPPITTLVEQALEMAVGELQVAVRAEHTSSEELIARLADEKSSPALKRQAAMALGQRQEAAAVDALSLALLEDDRDLANAAMGALTKIGDSRALDSIILYADNKPAIVRKQAIEAVRAMGTKKGQAWLFTMSTGHPDADVQSAAASALAALNAGDSAAVDDKPTAAAGGG